MGAEVAEGAVEATGADAVTSGASADGGDDEPASGRGSQPPSERSSASIDGSMLRGMSNQAPPPPGWGPPGGGPGPFGPAPAYDPYAAERALAEWAKERGFEISTAADFRSYHGWLPLQYLPRFDRVGRELRFSLGDARVSIVEALDSDPLKQAAGEHLNNLVFVVSPRFTARVAVRSKQVGGLADGISRGFSAIEGFFASGGHTGPPPGAVLGDPTLESRCDVLAPSREEGNAALPMPLRQLLVQPYFRGALEIRQGGLILTLYDYRRFDAPGLEALVAAAKQIIEAAMPASSEPAPT